MLVKNLPMAAKFLTILGVFGIFVVAMASGELLTSNSAAVKLTMARIALG